MLGLRAARVWVVVALAATVTAACGGSNAVESTPPVASTGQNRVTVQLADIQSVVTLDAEVVASPSFPIVAPAGGSIHFSTTPAHPGSTTVGIGWITDGPASTPIALPAYSGFVAWVVHDGDPVTVGLPVAQAYYSGFAVRAVVPKQKLYRFYGTVGQMRAQVTRGPGPFECGQLGRLGTGSVSSSQAQPAPDGTAGAAPLATAASLEVQSGPIELLCTAPRDLQFANGMPAILAVTTAEVHSVTVLPVSSVAGSSQQGRVTVVHADGTQEDRSVDLGITDGITIQITSGLKVGDVVAIPGPFLDGAPH